jgi:lipopolysaccharide-induced tumor necrosis factor-alpha factor
MASQPQPGGYPPPHGQQQSGQQTVIINHAAVLVAPFGFVPMRTTCPHCHSEITTAVEYEVGNYAWMICGIITLIGLFLAFCVLLGCCFIPFCMESCKDAVHICPNCRQTLARVPRHF